MASATHLESVDAPIEFQHKNERGRKLFSEAVQSWKKFPCSLHFNDAAPSEQAISALTLISDLLGPLGKYEGMYGAGGGPIHILYLGAPPENDDKDTKQQGASSSDLNTIIDMLRLSPKLAPPKTRWMSTLDPLHQYLFPKTMEDVEDFGTFMEQFYHLVASGGKIPTRVHYDDDQHLITQRDFAVYLKEESRIVFVQPQFDSIHSGECNDTECPRDDSVICESTEGVAREAGDIYESPCYAMIQLKKTGELIALAQWDYRD
jgi:hypothetical protein